MNPLDVLMWIMVVVLAATAAITLLALIGRVTLGGDGGRHHSFYLKSLFGALIIEVISVSVALYRDKMARDVDDALQPLKAEIKASVLADPGTAGVTGTQATKPDRIVLREKAYAISDGPRSDKVVVDIPDGWKYESHDIRRWTSNGHFDIGSVAFEPNKKNAKSISLTVKADKRGAFAARNWIGVELTVSIERQH